MTFLTFDNFILNVWFWFVIFFGKFFRKNKFFFSFDYVKFYLKDTNFPIKFVVLKFYFSMIFVVYFLYTLYIYYKHTFNVNITQ